MWLNGAERTTIPAPEWRQRVAMVPATAGWWAPDVRGHMGDSGAEMQRLLSAVGLPDALDWEVSRLSSGERQRLALVRALARGPDMLLLDEPTAALDPESVVRVEAVLRDCLANGLPVVLVSHDPDQIARLCDGWHRLERGKIVETSA